MAKLERTEFLTKWKGVIGEEKALDFLDDMADSFPENPEQPDGDIPQITIDYESEDNPYKKKHADLYQRYVDRFMGGKDEGEHDNEHQNTPEPEVDDGEYDASLFEEGD